MDQLRYPNDHYSKPLAQRWNIAMTKAGFVGSEWIDEPEKIAQEIKTETSDSRIQEKGTE